MQNVTTGCWIRLSRAERAIEQCAAEWVEEGRTIRNLSLAEAILARNEQARKREPLALAEIHEARVIPPPGAVWSSKLLALDANAFAAGYYHPVTA